MSVDSPVDKARLGVITLLYASPYQNLVAWVQKASIARRFPRIHNIAVVDVKRGPGLGPDEMYKQNIAMLKENNVTVLGYIAIEGHIDEIKENMKHWRNWYPEIDGIYLTGMSRDDTNSSFHEELVKYAKDYLQFKFVVAELSKIGKPKLPEQLITKSHIDIFVSYRDRNIPAPLDSLRGGIHPDKYQAHRFGVILTKLPVNAHSQNMVKNFMAQCITNDIARYFYFHTDDGSREIHPDPFQRISEFLDFTVHELERIAAGEDILPAPPGPSNPKEYYSKDAEKFLIPSEEADIAAQSNTSIKYDKFGIQQLLPNALGDEYQEWYFQQDRDVTKDSQLTNVKGAGLKRMQDGSKDTWYVSGNKVNLQVTSTSQKKKWLNTETTVFFKYLRDLKNKDKTPMAISLIARDGYEAFIYKEDGRTGLRKQVDNNLYTPTRATQPAITAHPVKGNWIGFKFIVNNIVEEDGKTVVVLETHVLQNCTGKDGQLVIPANQQWNMTSRFMDRGLWGLEDVKKEKKLKGKKKSTEILGDPSDTIELVCNGVEMVITNWSVREIRVDSND